MRVIDRLLGLAFLTVASAPFAAEAQAVSLEGTWAAKVKTTADFTVPLVGTTLADVAVAVRLDVKEENGQLNTVVELCELTTDSASLKVDYSKAIQYFKGSISIPSQSFAAGDKLPLPEINILVGQDDAGKSVDVDNDGKAGVTLPSTALGVLKLNAYTGLKLTLKLDATLASADSITGNGLLNSVGTIYGSDNALVTGGALNVVQKGPAPFNAKHFAGSVSCVDVLKQL